jgi:hypothetical protein
MRTDTSHERFGTRAACSGLNRETKIIFTHGSGRRDDQMGFLKSDALSTDSLNKKIKPT